MPRRNKSNTLKQAHVDLIDRVEKLVFAQLEQVMMSDFTDRVKMGHIVSIMDRRSESVDHLTMMFEEASCRHM